CHPIEARFAAIRVRWVLAYLGSFMQLGVVRIGWTAMAACAICLKDYGTAICGIRVEASHGGRRCGDRMLIVCQCWELGSHHVRRLLDLDADLGVGEIAMRAHLGHGDVRV